MKLVHVGTRLKILDLRWIIFLWLYPWPLNKWRHCDVKCLQRNNLKAIHVHLIGPDVERHRIKSLTWTWFCSCCTKLFFPQHELTKPVLPAELSIHILTFVSFLKRWSSSKDLIKDNLWFISAEKSERKWNKKWKVLRLDSNPWLRDHEAGALPSKSTIF